MRRSTAHQVVTSGGGSDGYGWHRHVLAGLQTYEASGNGGQFAIVIPDLELVVAITAGNYGQFPTWRGFRERLVAEFVISATARETRRR